MEYDSNLEKVNILFQLCLFSFFFLQILSDGTEDAGNEWVDTHHFAPEVNQSAKDIEVDDKPTNLEVAENNEEDGDDDAPAVDMDAFMESGDGEEDDPFRYVPEPKNKKEIVDDENILRTRTYDLHITYDKYYQVSSLKYAKF